MRATLFIILLCLSALTYAAPESSFSATAPTQYENGEGITATDVLTYKVYCGITPGGPYTQFYDAPGLTTTGVLIDVNTCVQGTPGTYYFVATAFSNENGTESVFSNETTKTYSSADLGKVPLPPVLFQITQ